MKFLHTSLALSAVLVVAFTSNLKAQETNAIRANAAVTRKTFQLVANPTFLACITGSSKAAPSATVTVVQGKLNDTLTINLKHFKPNLSFDMFTVENSTFLSDGTIDPAFVNFGLAWYQSDLQVSAGGSGTAKIQTILVDQIFGFDPAASLTPTNTFHVGFWFNNPADAASCGFNVSAPTPFNGEHAAGPLAMESVPDATTGLGPLCLNPSSTPGSCNN
jgi:hypothetical protein